ncbi:dehydrogenase, partial [Burkholderia glumae]
MARHAPPAASADAAPVVLVTGAARRAGRVFARRFGERGYRVAVHYDRSADAADAT